MPNKQDRDHNAKEWLKKAHQDEISVLALLKNNIGSPSVVCFLSQQMAEKLLKAYLVHKVKDFPKIHQLDRLVKMCTEIDDSFEVLKDDAIYLTAFYVTTRYPGDYPDFNWKAAKSAGDSAKKIKNFVLSKINE
ncbi:MAG: HEPN domain-containing protein [Candidatus Peregrinibacteria bacterium]|nr:HEPN domain-containing protein [Candidatus Peregrinibacteria bacterium]